MADHRSLAPALTLVEKLVIGGQVAPVLRGRTRSRPITTVDADGNIVRQVDSVRLAAKVLERAGIEFDVTDGAPKKKQTCPCGRLYFVPMRVGTTGLQRQMTKWCSVCRAKACAACGAPVSRKTRARQLRQGQAPLCRSCVPRPVRVPCGQCGTELKTKKGTTRLKCVKCGALSRDPKRGQVSSCSSCGALEPGGEGYWRKGQCIRCYQRARSAMQAPARTV